MLQLHLGRECCDKDLPPESEEARICSFECTFCVSCAKTTLGGKCPVDADRKLTMRRDG